MNSLPLPDGRTAVTAREERVLLSVRGERDRTLLRERLEDEFEVVEGTPESVESFDLCVTDERGYAASESHLEARRRAETPAFLPVLVLAGEARPVPRHADDVVVVPTQRELLCSRIRALLRTRRLTWELSLFRRAIDEATVGVSIALAEDDLALVYVNDAFVRITGYEREEILGRNCRFLQGADTDSEPVIELRAATDEGRTTTVVLRNYRADGTPFWNEVSLMPVRTGHEVTHFVGFQTDVTDRVELEQSLREERDLFADLFENSPVGVVLLDPEGNIRRANEHAEGVLGLEASELAGRTYADPEWDIVDERGHSILPADLPFSRAMRGERVRDYRHAIRTDEGLRWLSINAAPRRADGEVVGVLTTVQDITDRVRRERELEQYEAIVDSMREAAWIFDSDGRFAFVNPNVTQGAIDDPMELIGEPLSALARFFPEDGTMERYERYVYEILAGEREEARLVIEPQLAEPSLTIELTLAPLERDGEIEGVVGLSRDVTERVERDRRISVLDRVLRHNLRNKLNVVLANVRDLDLGGADAALVSGIETAAEELLSLSDTARRFESTIRPGDGMVRPIDVSCHVEHVVEEASLVHGADVSLDSCEAVWALAHESLELAIQELVENAIVHGTTPVSVSVTDRPEAGVVEITVADEGPGLPEMERAVLLRGTETPLEHMEGLGLWFANWAVTESGGSVSVAENAPRGTAVTITLPRA